MNKILITTSSIGRKALAVPLLGVGTAPLGGFMGPVSDEQAAQTLYTAIAAGANLIDTAPFYDRGVAEERVGKALAALPRDRYILATKVGQVVPVGQRQNHVDFSRAGVLASLETSRTSLGVERFDILHIHNPQLGLQSALDEAYPVLDEMRTRGELAAIGVGVDHCEPLDEFLRHANLDCALLAGRYTLLEQGARSTLDECQRRGVRILMAGVYNSGILAQGAVPGALYRYRPAPPAILERVAQMEALCARFGISLKAAALQFPLAHPAAVGLVVGAMSAQEFRQTMEALFEPIPAELWNAFKQARLLSEDVPTPTENRAQP